ncbi:MAG: Hint domain-containing protein, partial [Patescibacteria group bacterium]
MKNGDGLLGIRIGDYFNDLERQYPEAVRQISGVTLIEPEGINLLSFDLEKQETCYKPLQLLSRREYHGTMVDIITVDGRSLRVTDEHPMVIWAEHAPRIKRAADLQAGDELIVPTQWPEGSVARQRNWELGIRNAEFPSVSFDQTFLSP